MHARSFCPLDCPDGCSVTVTTTADGWTIDGDHRNPLTDGFICDKVRRFRAHVESPERITRPLVRRGPKGEGVFAQTSWDDALALIAARLAEVRERHGGEAILPMSYGGSNGYLTQGSADERLWTRLGACRLERTFCAAPSGRAMLSMTGKMPGTPLVDYEHARFIAVWGCNPHATGIHLLPILKRARAAGAKLAVLDPRRTRLAESADMFLPVRPGTDLPVALAAIHWLFEKDLADRAFLAEHTTGAEELERRAAAWTPERAAQVAGVEARQICALAEALHGTKPAVIRCGWGVERTRHGGSAVASVLALAAVAGTYGARGGGFTMSQSGAWPIDAARALGLEPNPSRRTVNISQLGRALTELDSPRVHALFVYNANPWATAPRQASVAEGLRREDLFTVVAEQVMTDTARFADVVLPVTTFLEHQELARSYGSMTLGSSEPALPARGEARCNFDVFTAITERLGLLRESDVRTAAEARAQILAHVDPSGALAARLAEDGVSLPLGEAHVPFVTGFPRTMDRKLHLVPADLDGEAPGGLYHFEPPPAARPLRVISPASDQTISSTFGQLLRHAVAEMHPDDAAPRGLSSGNLMRLRGGEAEVVCEVKVSGRVRPGVIVLQKGLWARHTRNGFTANALVPDHLSDLGGGACYNDAEVEAERV